LLCMRSLGGLLLAAMAAGSCCVSAAAAQSAGPNSSTAPRKKSAPAYKSSSSLASHSSVTHTSSKISKSSNKKKSKRVKGQAAPTPERISEIQEALARKGPFAGTPTGKWADEPVEAMRKFQASNGLNPSGRLDAPTLQKLGLGSETTGLGAPTPPPNSANRLLNNTSSPPEPPSEPRE